MQQIVSKKKLLPDYTRYKINNVFFLKKNITRGPVFYFISKEKVKKKKFSPPK